MANTKLFIYKIQPVRQEMVTQVATADEERIVAKHFKYLESLTQQGVVHLAGGHSRTTMRASALSSSAPHRRRQHRASSRAIRP